MLSCCQVLWEGLSHCCVSPVLPFSVWERLPEPAVTWARNLFYFMFILFSSHKLQCDLSLATQIPLANGYHNHSKIIKDIWENYEKIVLCHLLLFCETLLCVYFVLMLMTFDDFCYFQVVSGNCTCVFGHTFSNLYLDLSKIRFLKLISVLSKNTHIKNVNSCSSWAAIVLAIRTVHKFQMYCSKHILWLF